MNLSLSHWLQRDETPLGLGGQTDPNFVNFPCEVTGRIEDAVFLVRGENGRSYKVQAAHCLAHLMDQHARVRISGFIREGIVWAERIIPLGSRTSLKPAMARRHH